MHSLTPDFLSKLRYDGLQVATLRTLGEFRGKQQLLIAQSSEILSDLKQLSVIESTASSNRLEGIVVTPGRLKSLVVKNADPKSRSEQEVAGYRDALELIHGSAQKMSFSENIIQQLHSMLFLYIPNGEHRETTSNNIIVCQPKGGSRAHFCPVSASPTPMAMIDMIMCYRNAVEQNLADPLVLVPLSILDFLCISPFPDGNGRVARLLTLLLLYQSGYSVVRFVSFERILENTKESYYAAFEASSHGWQEGKHNVQPWLNYFWRALLDTYNEFEKNVGTINNCHGGKSDRVRMEALKRTLPFSISEIENACAGVSRDTVRLVLRALKSEGLIEPTGKGRSAKWKKTASLISTSLEGNCE